MTEKVALRVSKDVKEKLARMGAEAAEGGLSADKLAEVLLSSFFSGDGKIFTARWKEGPGIRVLPDWPRFSSGIIKVKTEDMR